MVSVKAFIFHISTPCSKIFLKVSRLSSKGQISRFWFFEKKKKRKKGKTFGEH